MGADLADMQLISKFNKEIRFLVCAADIYSKYAWVIHLKDKNDIAITNAFQKVLKESNRCVIVLSNRHSKTRKPNKIWVDKSSEFYNRLMKSWLEKKT